MKKDSMFLTEWDITKLFLVQLNTNLKIESMNCGHNKVYLYIRIEFYSQLILALITIIKAFLSLFMALLV